MAMEKARWAESALAQCEERGEAANARALLETSLAKYVEAFVTAKLTRDDRAIHPDILAADYERVGQLIDEGADVDAKAAGWAPIHLAVYHDDPRLLALLIARGADINLPATRRSYTPLIYAAIAENLNATEQLLNARADPGPPAPTSTGRRSTTRSSTARTSSIGSTASAATTRSWAR